MNRLRSNRRKDAEPFAHLPNTEQLEAELQRERYKKRYHRVLRSTVYALIVTAAVSVLVATLWLPILRITGSSMSPTLEDGQIVLSLKGSACKQGDLISFYIGNKILIKRVIALPGQWVDMDEEGNVYINEQRLDEPYLVEKAFGECDLELPYQVPDGQYFVMGDHRSTSVDSRSSAVGCITDDQIVGRIVFGVWPFSKFGSLE